MIIQQGCAFLKLQFVRLQGVGFQYWEPSKLRSNVQQKLHRGRADSNGFWGYIIVYVGKDYKGILALSTYYADTRSRSPLLRPRLQRNTGRSSEAERGRNDGWLCVYMTYARMYVCTYVRTDGRMHIDICTYIHTWHALHTYIDT